jgi:arylsulfatase
MAFDDKKIEVLIAGYLSRDAAHEDFESVRHSGGYVHGATVVGKDLEGNLSAEQTDHAVREGVKGMAAVGFIVGLAVPPLLIATTATGAAMGAGVGMLLHRFTAHELKERAGETIPIGGAGLIVAYPKTSADKVTPAVKRAISIATGEAEGHHLKALTGALADAQRNTASPTS